MLLLDEILKSFTFANKIIHLFMDHMKQLLNFIEMISFIIYKKKFTTIVINPI